MSIFRDTFPTEIRSSLNIRQNAMTNRTPENIQYMNSRNSWIRMTSSVNVGGSNSLAKKYVLHGGTLVEGQNLRSGVGNGTNDAYSNVSPSGKKNILGIRPMPGITGLDINSKTQYGSLREATIKFQCWDMSQLEDLELLYMRPGYTVLVEWGWAPYIDSKGYHATFTDFYSDELLKLNNNKARTEIFKELYQKSIKYGGNYDAMFGYIKNFEWSAREDGGYDCQTTLISTGEIIESLKVNYVRADLKSLKMYDSGSIGDGFLNGLFETQGNNPSMKFVDYYQKNTLAGMWAELNLKLKDPNAVKKFSNFTVANFPGFLNYGDFDAFVEPGSGYKAYINLESAFEIMNRYIIAQSNDEPLIKLSTKTETYSGGMEDNLLCVAHPLQVSLDPTVCLIKSPLWYEDVSKVVSGSAELVALAVAETLTQQSPIPTTSPTTTTPTTPSITIDPIDGTAQISKPKQQITGISAEDKKKATDAYNSILEAAKPFVFFGLDVGGTFNRSLVSAIKLISNRKIYDEVNLRMARNKELVDDNIASIQAILNDEFGENDYEFIIQIKEILEKPEVGLKVEFKTKTSRDQNNPIKLIENSIAISEVNPSNTSTTPATTYTASGSTVIATTVDPPPSTDPTAFPTTTTSVTVFSVSNALASIQELEKIKNHFFFKAEPNRELGVIGEIYVSVDFLYRQSLSQGLESSDGKEKNEINLYGYLKSVMSGIQRALGNINNFEIHVDPVDNVARVIDINYTSPTKPSNLFELQVHKTNSIVRSYSLQSQIFPSQTTVVSTASQTRGGQMGIQNNTMIDFNRKLTDRIIQKKQDPSNSVLNDPKYADNEDEEIKGALGVASSLASIVLLFGFIGNKPIDGTPSTLNISELISKSKNAMRDIIVYFQTIQTASPGRNRNIIPTKFSFKLDGIGGLVIGSIFKTNEDIIPSGYKGVKKGGIGTELARVITKIGHSISNGDWTTDIDTQTFILDRPEFGTFGQFNIVDKIKEVLPLIIKNKIGFPPPPKFNIFSGGGGNNFTGGSADDFDLFFYLSWQQGQSGAAQHYSLWKRNGKKTKYAIPIANIRDNWPGSSSGEGGWKTGKGYSASNVSTLYNSNQSELAEAFVDVQRQLYAKKSSSAIEVINSGGKNRAGVLYSDIKVAFQKYARPDIGLTWEKLASFGMIENGLETDTTSGANYQGMFQVSREFFSPQLSQISKTTLPNGNINYDIDSYVRVMVPTIISNFESFKKEAGWT